MLPDWHRAHGEPVLECRLRQTNADFRVDEQLGFEPSGDGEHDYLHIEKDGGNTTWVAGGLARFAKVREADVGFAGMKDRKAVTTQWFSVRRPAGDRADWSQLELAGVRIMRADRHRRKLRRGAHTGNRFHINLRNCSETGDALPQRLTTIAERGVPNYFGEQRFGIDGGNLDLARDLFAGKRLSRRKRSLALSAPRSFLFNHILEDRVKRGTWDSLQAGDCANLDGSASIFSVESVDEELQRRCVHLDLHPSGALWGAGPLQSAAAVADRERSIAGRYPHFAKGLEEQRMKQARRSLRLAVRDFRWDRDGDSLSLRFFLVRGGYAIAVLREIARY